MNRRHAILLAVPIAVSLNAAVEARSPAKVIDEEHCATEPVPDELVPADVDEQFALGSPVHGDGALWSMAPDRTWLTDVTDRTDPAVAGLKLGWYRTEPGHVEITTELFASSEEQLRPDWDPPEATVRVPDGYGLTGFQVSGIEFPASGCWSIMGELVRPQAPRRVVATVSFFWWVPESPA